MDQECVHFLQWALPKLDMRWPGFRKVRGQVCKRIKKRMHCLGIINWEAYRHYLEEDEEEWNILDDLCRVTISRFYRDYVIFDYLRDGVIPRQIRELQRIRKYRCISIGCASGEEPYTMAIMWQEMRASLNPDIPIRIVGLEADPVLIQRASEGMYPASSLRELPRQWKERFFTEKNEMYTLNRDCRKQVQFIKTDFRKYHFQESYHLVLCRNLVATYYSEELQASMFRKIRSAMVEGGALLMGVHEKLPDQILGFQQDEVIRQIYWAIQ